MRGCGSPFGSIFFFKQKTAYEVCYGLVGSEMCIGDRSSVYTFFDPDVAGASFGTYNILWQAQQCRALNLPYLYLGYWIANSRKMVYKSRFRPIEGLIDGHWQTLDIPDREP